MSELRQKMIRMMELKNLAKKSQRSYLAAVKGLAKHYSKSPDEISVHPQNLWVGSGSGRSPSV